MKRVSSTLLAFINASNEFRTVDLYEITLAQTEGVNLFANPTGPFLSGAWSHGPGLSETSGLADSAGGLTASLISASGARMTSSTTYFEFYQNIATTLKGIYRFRIYLKLGSTDPYRLPPTFIPDGFGFGGTVSVGGGVSFGAGDVGLFSLGLDPDALLLANAMTAIPTLSGPILDIVPSVTSIGDGWYCFQADCIVDDNPAHVGFSFPFSNPFQFSGSGDTFSYSGETMLVAFPYFGAFPQQTLRFVDGGFPVVYNGFQFSTLNGFKREGVHWTAMPEVQSMNVTMFTRPDILYGSLTLAQAAVAGLFDGARLKISKAYLDPAGNIVDALNHFEGNVSAVEPTSTTIKLTVKSELERLNLKVPYNLFQANCDRAFLDAGCDPNPPGTLRAASTSTGAIAGFTLITDAFGQPLSSETTSDIQITGSFSMNHFQLGVIFFTSGVCTGQRRAIRSDFDVIGLGLHNLSLAVPLPNAPAVGDTYTLTLGCDRTQATCALKNNSQHFRGFPNIPVPEATT